MRQHAQMSTSPPSRKRQLVGVTTPENTRVMVRAFSRSVDRGTRLVFEDYGDWFSSKRKRAAPDVRKVEEAALLFQYGEYEAQPSFSDLAKPTRPVLAFKPTDGVAFDDARRTAAHRGFSDTRRHLLSAGHIHQSHVRAQATWLCRARRAAWEHSDIFFGISAASVPWGPGACAGFDVSGRMFYGSSLSTARVCGARSEFKIPVTIEKRVEDGDEGDDERRLSVMRVHVDLETATAQVSLHPCYKSPDDLGSPRWKVKLSLPRETWPAARLYVTFSTREDEVELLHAA